MLIGQLFKAIVELNLAWLVGLVFNNLFWVFAFAALACYMFPKKSLFWGAIVVWLLSWMAIDFTIAVGWVLLSAGFFCFHYIFRLAAVMFAETSDSLKKHIPLIIQLQFVAALVIYNYFIL
jgi:hypothetical protein